MLPTERKTTRGKTEKFQGIMEFKSHAMADAISIYVCLVPQKKTCVPWKPFVSTRSISMIVFCSLFRSSLDLEGGSMLTSYILQSHLGSLWFPNAQFNCAEGFSSWKTCDVCLWCMALHVCICLHCLSITICLHCIMLGCPITEPYTSIPYIAHCK